MDYERLINGMKRFGSNEHDICVYGLGITPSQVQDNVVIAPWWEPATFHGLGKAEYLSESDYSSVNIWNIVSDTFTAAQIAHIPIAAIFSVSDNTISNKSLVSGRTEEEMNYRKYVRRELFPQIILETLHG